MIEVWFRVWKQFAASIMVRAFGRLWVKWSKSKFYWNYRSIGKKIFKRITSDHSKPNHDGTKNNISSSNKLPNCQTEIFSITISGPFL